MRQPEELSKWRFKLFELLLVHMLTQDGRRSTIDSIMRLIEQHMLPFVLDGALPPPPTENSDAGP